ncbi:hypothetical protein PG984_000987 [Apiospora sp. TS-2023a]
MKRFIADYVNITPVPLAIATPPIDLAGFELRSLRKHYAAGRAERLGMCDLALGLNQPNATAQHSWDYDTNIWGIGEKKRGRRQTGHLHDEPFSLFPGGDTACVQLCPS